MKPLLCLLLLTGCTAQTRSYYASGKIRFVTNANCQSLTVDKDGALTMTGVDHSTPQRELANTVTARAQGVGAIGAAVAGSTLFK